MILSPLAFASGMFAAAATPYPPDPPPLGAPMPWRDAAGNRVAVSADLTPLLNENFYPALSLLLAANDGTLSASLRARVDAYRATKAALQTELWARIDLLRDTDAPDRVSELQQFARDQTPRIVALESSAERLRRDLIGALGSSAPRMRPERDADAWREAAFFAEGLLPGQRRLLREAAMEAEAAGSSAAAGGPWFGFSPESSRLKPLEGLSGECSAKLAAYQKQKAALKNALCESVRKGSARELAQLAEQQAPRIADLEALAEEIRRGLAVRNDPSRRPDLPPLSPELDARIVAYRAEKQSLQKALLARVDEISRTASPNSRGTDRHGRAADRVAAQQQEKIRDAIAAFTQSNAARYAALERNKEAIRTDLARLANAQGGPGSATSADALLKKFSEAMQQIEVWRNYREYQIAVLQPGLSPEQRRLLFDAALEKLVLENATAAAP